MFGHFDPLRIVLVAPVVLFAVTVHEAAHAWLAARLGDVTAQDAGRISLNPFRHLDPIGTIALLLLGFGWARPVPVNPFYLRSQARDLALTSLAGPLANILAALLFGLLARLLALAGIGGFLATVVHLGVSINLGLAAFNLIPIPPLDGSRVVYYLLPRPWAARYIGLERFGMWLVIGLVFLDSWTGIIHSWLFLFVRVIGGIFAGQGYAI